MIIDSHHHFWNYNPVEFDWIDEEMAAIRKSFLPGDLKQTLDGNGVDGVVSVHARQCLEETGWLLRLAAENDFMRGVVGWLPLADKTINELLRHYAANPWLKGIRHVVQGEPDPEFILGKDFNRGISLLKNYGLVYDILIFEHQLPNTIRFVDQHPEQQFVLDHIAKPKIKANEITAWAKKLKELAKRGNVSCKISGMVTEADYKNWTAEQLQPYFDVVLEAFGPSRLLYGSDWPVCLVATPYADWLKLVKKVLSALSEAEQKQIFYENAVRIYQL
ncbi:amidohydrolase family protein [Gaoshiqia sediminis]|uniref:Amidohydrolase family protein n=1 Tax=Gaoshiqia sediminis TaxID=2986998 RepID=A0AA42C5M8_9BACT|nr:amidohydrolase family protein [Gaoshiqia sediminis]MCW0483018.1 amidohydrolase family protein [Gaoshiqia sediminis]